MNAATKEKIAWRKKEMDSLYDGWPWYLVLKQNQERICKLRDEIIDLKHEVVEPKVKKN